MDTDTQRLLTALKQAKLMFPQLRLGQIIINAYFTEEAMNDGRASDIFYVNDGVLADAVTEYTRNMGKYTP